LAANLSPDVERPAGLRLHAGCRVLDVFRRREAGAATAELGVLAVYLAAGRAGVRVAATDGEIRQQRSAIDHDHGLRGSISGLGLLEGLIVHDDLALQAIEQRIVVDRPPGLVGRDLARIGRLPILIFLVYRRDGGRRAMVVRAHCTAGRESRGQQEQGAHAGADSAGRVLHARLIVVLKIVVTESVYRRPRTAALRVATCASSIRSMAVPAGSTWAQAGCCSGGSIPLSRRGRRRNSPLLQIRKRSMYR